MVQLIDLDSTSYNLAWYLFRESAEETLGLS